MFGLQDNDLENEARALISGTVFKLWRNADRQLHRAGGPAVEFADGSTLWFRNGLLHRENGPAAEWSNGTKEWFRHNKRHRDGGPALERLSGTRAWYRDDKLHRIEGPAIEMSNGTKKWLRHGKLHRSDGPAIERGDGTQEWWIDGCEMILAEAAALQTILQQWDRECDAMIDQVSRELKKDSD